MSLTTAARLKQLLRLPASVTFHDVRLGQVADAANAHVLKAIGQATLALNTVTEYPSVYGPRQRAVQLRHRPIAEIVAITNASTAVPASAYRTDDDLAEVRLLPAADNSPIFWSDVPDDVEVMYGYGYTEATAPDDLRQAADSLALWFYNRGPSQGVSSEKRGPNTVSLRDEDLPAEVRYILAGYRDPHPV